MNAVAEFDADTPSFQLPPMVQEIRDMTRRIVRDELMPLEQQYLASDWATYGATMENLGEKTATVYYQIDYSLEAVAENTPYFHAQFRRSNPLPFKEVYTILDGIQGRGHYVGTYLAHGANSPGWWGEGEIKFYIDGDSDFPTICGTGEEDYFCGSYGYNEHKKDGKDAYDRFSSPYTGFYPVPHKGGQRRFGQYRWHIADPVRFEKDLRVTIQSLGWQSEGRYLPLQDDLASVGYWYQVEPHNPFPPLPAKEKLVIAE